MSKPTAEPGDRLFAWLMRGLNAEGVAVNVKGHMAARNEELATCRLEAGDALIHVPDAAHRPVRNVIVDVWEIPFWHMVDVLQANGYEAKGPGGYHAKPKQEPTWCPDQKPSKPPA